MPSKQPKPSDTPEPEDQLASLRAARDAARRDRDNAVAARNAASAARGAISPASFSTPAAHRAAVITADRALADAEADVSFFADKLSRAEVTLHQAEVVDMRQGIDGAIRARGLALSVLRDAALALAQQLSAPGAISETVQLTRDAEASINELTCALQEAREPVPAVPYDELAARLPALVSREAGAIGALVTASNIARFIAQEPERERDRQAVEEQRRREDARAHQEAALRGTFGEEERRRAMAEERRLTAQFYGHAVHGEAARFLTAES